MKLQDVLKLPVYSAIIKFFRDNPASVDTVRGISTWINTDLEETKRALENLVKLGALTRHQTLNTIAYAYTQNKRMLQQISKINMVTGTAL